MKRSKLWIAVIMITVLLGTSGAYALSEGTSTVEAKSKYCSIKKCTKTTKHKHKVCKKTNCTKTKAHKHSGKYYKGHKKTDGHSYHTSTCTVSGCKKLNHHTHDSGNHNEEHSGGGHH